MDSSRKVIRKRRLFLGREKCSLVAITRYILRLAVILGERVKTPDRTNTFRPDGEGEQEAKTFIIKVKRNGTT